MDKLLIAGIDPGTTTGYAFLDHHGSPIHIGSAKGLGHDEVVRICREQGHVLIIGTDKAKTPDLISSLGTTIGAIVITPSQDLLSKDKIKEQGKNHHERDALSAARFAYKKQQTLLKRIKRFADNKQISFVPLARIVLQRQLSIVHAYDLLNTKESHNTITKTPSRDFASEIQRLSKRIIALKEELFRKKQCYQQQQKKVQQLQQQLREKKKQPSPRIPYSEKHARIIAELYKKLREKDRYLTQEKKKHADLQIFLQQDTKKLFVQHLHTLAKKVKRTSKHLYIDNPEAYSTAFLNTLCDVHLYFSQTPGEQICKELARRSIPYTCPVTLHNIQNIPYLFTTEITQAQQSKQHLSHLIKTYQQRFKEQ
ncbi:DUF460 domain-containing protein [Candidatus Woesearchaeota archaeon]|nr:DUF460 domain-containing protein [Candidatus Woesearchaeota archaeon]